jgi:ABC-type transport system involved in multi-copper enzyme maturation permease subunit
MRKMLENSIKSTPDLVVFALAVFVCTTLFLSVVGVFIYAFVNPNKEFNEPLKTVMDIITVIVGALVGFIGGKAAGREEGISEERGRNGSG